MLNNQDNPPRIGSQIQTAALNRHAVRVGGVMKHFGDVVALQETSFAVERGEFLTLLGPSGCGKTTILNLVAGFLTSDRGEIFLDGTPITTEPAF